MRSQMRESFINIRNLRSFTYQHGLLRLPDFLWLSSTRLCCIYDLIVLSCFSIFKEIQYVEQKAILLPDQSKLKLVIFHLSNQCKFCLQLEDKIVHFVGSLVFVWHLYQEPNCLKMAESTVVKIHAPVVVLCPKQLSIFLQLVHKWRRNMEIC